MMDSNIDPSSGESQKSEDVHYELTQKDSNTYLSIIADKNWLESPDRVFPIYIDPSTSASPTGDAYVTSKYPDSNFNSDWNSTDGYYQLKSGYYDSTTGTNYSYLKFDLSSVSGKLVTAASLKLYCNHSYYATTPNAVWIDTVNSAWDQSTLNWTNKPSSTFLTTGNAVRDSWASFDVTKAVAGWASYPAKSANYGFKIHENGNGQAYWKKFRSMGNTSGNPYISITYSEIPAAPTATMFTTNDGSDTRFVDLAWSPVAGATGYKVAIFNGKDYEYFDVPGGSTTSWTSYNKKIWPTAAEISQGRYLLHSDGLGSELPYDPNGVYVNSKGSYTNAHHYYFRVKAYNANGESNVSTATVVFFPRNDDVFLGDEGYYSSYDNRIGYGISKTNIANGNLFLGYNDISIDGRGIDLAVNRSFNSLDNSTGILGRGWRLSYEMNLNENANGDVLFTDADGSRHIFNKNGSGYYHGAGVFFDLIKNASDNTYTMADRNKTVYKFNSAGKLASVTDNNGNTLSIVYDVSGKISKVIDAVNRELTFSYGTNTVTITDPAARKVEYTLENGGLTQVKYLYKDQDNQYKLDKSILYNYGTDESLTVTNPNGDNVVYNLSGGKVNSFTKDLTLYSNNNLNGTLNKPTTTFTYDTAARTTTVIYPMDNQRTGAEKYIYNVDGTLKNKIIYPEADKPITYYFQYNANLQLTREYDGKGNVTAYAYDNLDRLDSAKLPQTKDFDGTLQPTLVLDYIYGDSNNPYKYTEVQQKELGTNGVYNAPKTRISQYAYFSNGNLKEENVDVSAEDGSINEHSITEYSYDSYGNLKTKKVHRNANDNVNDILTTVFNYDSYGLYYKTIIDPSTKTASYDFDYNTGYLKSYTDTNNTKTTNEYYPYGQVKSETTNYISDTQGKWNTQALSFEYDRSGNRIKSTSPKGYITNYVYNENNQQVIAESPQVTVSDYGTTETTGIENIKTYSFYDLDGNLTGVKDANGNVTSSEFDGTGRLVKSTDAKGNAIGYEYDLNSNKISETRYKKDGTKVSKVSYSYDERNRLTGETKPAVGQDLAGDVKKYIKMYYYDVFDNLERTKSIDNDTNAARTVNYIYYKSNQVNEVYDSSDPSITTKYIYDNAGNKKLEIVGGNINTAFDYDNLNRLIKVIVPDSKITQYNYREEIVSATDVIIQRTTVKPEGDSIVEQYDGLNRLINQTALDKAGGKINETRYTYDDEGNLDSQTIIGKDGSQQLTENTFDELGRKNSETITKNNDASKKIERKFRYDSNGNLKTIWFKDYSQAIDGQPLQDRTDYNYDELNRETSNSNVNLGSSIQSLKEFNDDSRELEINNTMSYKDVQSTLNVKLNFDEENKVDRIYVDGSTSPFIDYDYYDNGMVKTINQKGNTAEYSYNNEKIETIKITNKLNPIIPLYERAYTYNNIGKLEEIRNGGDPKASPMLKKYTYTPAGQVATVTNSDNTKINYQYDGNGNLINISDEKTNTETIFTISPDNKNILNKSTVKESGKPDVITDYSYDDANGNLIKTTNGTVVTDYDYNGENQLLSVTTKDAGVISKSISYKYNGEGKRTEKTIGNTKYTIFYDNDLAVGEIIDDGNSTKEIDYIADSYGNLTGLKYNSKYYYYQFNNRGDIIAITDEAGNIAASYDYDTWGNVTITADNADKIGELNIYRYVGKYGVTYDSDLNMYFMGFRDYDPTTGRYIIPDTVDGDEDTPLSQNKYLYAEGDPINNIDPDGHWIIDAIFLAVDVVDFIKKPTWGKAAMIGLDLLSFADVTGAASTALHAVTATIKTAKAVDHAIDGAKAVKKTVNVVKEISKAKKVYKVVKKTAKAEKAVDSLYDVAVAGDKVKDFAEGVSNASENIVYRALNPKDAERLSQGLSLEAKNPAGTWKLDEHLIGGSGKASWANDPFISTTTDIDVARGFNQSGSNLGIVKIDLNKVPSQALKGYEIYPRVNGVEGLPYHYSIWQQETSVYQNIPIEAIKGFVK